MRDFNEIPAREFIFGTLFVASNRLDTLLERELKEFDITTKQWFLSITIGALFNEPPTIKQTAQQMGCSHQNAKQVALKLQEKGLLQLQKDANDRRITRMSLTQKSDRLWQEINPKGNEFMNAVFEGISKEDMETVKSALLKILINLEKLDNH